MLLRQPSLSSALAPRRGKMSSTSRVASTAVFTRQRKTGRAAASAARSRTSLVVEANELNKWANHDASDDIEGENEDDYSFDRDTSRVVLRVLTARSVQKVLMQLGDTDIFVQQWFNNYIANGNPPLEGDAFISKLFRQRAVYAQDKTTGTDHFVSPAQLAHRVLAARELMARGVTQGFPEFVTRTNIEVLRAHLEAHSYTSGSHEKGGAASGSGSSVAGGGGGESGERGGGSGRRG